MSNKRVVVTGYGIVSCIGDNKKEVLQSLRDVKSGISHCKKYEELGMRSHVHGKPKINIEAVSYTHLTLPTNREV